MLIRRENFVWNFLRIDLFHPYFLPPPPTLPPPQDKSKRSDRDVHRVVNVVFFGVEASDVTASVGLGRGVPAPQYPPPLNWSHPQHPPNNPSSTLLKPPNRRESTNVYTTLPPPGSPPPTPRSVPSAPKKARLAERMPGVVALFGWSIRRLEYADGRSRMCTVLPSSTPLPPFWPPRPFLGCPIFFPPVSSALLHFLSTFFPRRRRHERTSDVGGWVVERVGRPVVWRGRGVGEWRERALFDFFRLFCHPPPAPASPYSRLRLRASAAFFCYRALSQLSSRATSTRYCHIR